MPESLTDEDLARMVRATEGDERLMIELVQRVYRLGRQHGGDHMLETVKEILDRDG